MNDAYLVRYRTEGGWCMGIVYAWDSFSAVGILARRKRALEVDRPKKISNHLRYYRDNLKIEEVNR